MREVEVLVPTVETKPVKVEMAKRPGSLTEKVAGFLWNAKPNGDLLLRHLEQILKDKLKLSATVMERKPLASSGAPNEVIKTLSAKCDFVILAIGD